MNRSKINYVLEEKAMKDILILLLALTGCMETEIPEVNPEVVSKSVEHSVTIVNDAANTTLHIEGCNLANIKPAVLKYNDTIILEELKNESDTIVFDGGISSNGFWLYEGLMYAPFGRVIKALDLCDSTWNKILHPISFDAEVNDWEQ
jgi:hypothetical protein